MNNQDKIKIVKLQIDNRKWQILNEDRLDKDSIQKEINDLEIELKGLENKVKEEENWNKWFNKSNAKIISKEWNDDDYDNLRESEEATEIALSNLE